MRLLTSITNNLDYTEEEFIERILKQDTLFLQKFLGYDITNRTIDDGDIEDVLSQMPCEEIDKFWVKMNSKLTISTEVIQCTNITNEKLQILKKKYDYVEGLELILNTHAEDWKQYPMDREEIDELCSQLKQKLNLMNGNITEQEYESLLQ